MCEETEKFFNVIGLERNRDSLQEIAVPLAANEDYKYIGITENRESKLSRETYEKIRIEILKRFEKIRKTSLNMHYQ